MINPNSITILATICIAIPSIVLVAFGIFVVISDIVDKVKSRDWITIIVNGLVVMFVAGVLLFTASRLIER